MRIKSLVFTGTLSLAVILSVPAIAAQGSFSYTHNGVNDPFLTVAQHAVTDNQATMKTGSVIRNVAVVFTEPTFYYNIQLGNEEEKGLGLNYWNDFYLGYRTTGGGFSVNWFKDARSYRNQDVSYVIERISTDVANDTSTWGIKLYTPDGIYTAGPATTKYRTVYQNMIVTYGEKACSPSVRSAWHAWRYQDNQGLKWFYGASGFDTTSCSPILYGKHNGDPMRVRLSSPECA